ncbi:MAG: acyltransferase family protein [Acidobacteria bacterium]|nr:acyltransferase family protein [Acidobacteriota bacterium]
MGNGIAVSERRYDIDTLRIFLILSVFLFHIGIFFSDLGWYINNPEKLSWLDPILVYLHQWRMPLLFLVSGAGTYFALGHKSIFHFMGERSRRLLIPLVFGVFVIVPPQIYIEKKAEYDSFLNFIPHLFEGVYPQGNFGWHHLWFVLYLFVCATAAIPVILMLRSRIGNGIYRLLERLSSIEGSFLLLAVPLFLSQILLLRHFPQETHALIDDWAYVSYSYLFFLYGYVLLSKSVLVENLIKQRRIYAGYALSLSFFFFLCWYSGIEPYIHNSIELFLSCLSTLSMALAFVGYAAKYLNRDYGWRQYLNEAIYPFYILHQTAIIIFAYLLVNSRLAIGMKASILALGSFTACVVVFVLFIRPFNFTRLLFGMHRKRELHAKS